MSHRWSSEDDPRVYKKLRIRHGPVNSKQHRISGKRLESDICLSSSFQSCGIHIVIDVVEDLIVFRKYDDNRRLGVIMIPEEGAQIGHRYSNYCCRYQG